MQHRILRFNLKSLYSIVNYYFFSYMPVWKVGVQRLPEYMAPGAHKVKGLAQALNRCSLMVLGFEHPALLSVTQLPYQRLNNMQYHDA